jgi:hypothetical protein
MEGKVRVVLPATPVPVRDVWPLNGHLASYLRYRLAVPSIASAVAAERQGAPDLIWTTVPGSARALRKLFPRAFLVFHVVDYYPAFRGDAIKPIEIEDYTIADKVYTIGGSLAAYVIDELGVAKEKVAVLGQGVELERYSRNNTVPSDIAQLPHPRAVWTGVLAKGDPELFDTVASRIEAVGGSLILVGSTAPWADNLRAQYPETVHVLGPKAATRIPAYLEACDVGLMLYTRQKSAVYKGQNPLKLYEYAAAGLSIISTPHDEYEYSAPPAQVVSSVDETLQALDRLLSAGRDQNRAAALDFARRHDWGSKVKDVIARHFPEMAQSAT